MMISEGVEELKFDAIEGVYMEKAVLSQSTWTVLEGRREVNSLQVSPSCRFVVLDFVVRFQGNTR